jgi:exonuclease SbcC
MPENTLTLTADEVNVAMEQQSRSRTQRQRLTSLHARYQPLQKRLRQSNESVQKAQAEQSKLNETLTLRRQQYKEKHQHYLDLKACASVKRQLKIWKAIVHSLRQANLVPCAVPASIPPLSNINRLS